MHVFEKSLFLHRSLILKSQQNRIVLVARPEFLSAFNDDDDDEEGDSDGDARMTSPKRVGAVFVH